MAKLNGDYLREQLNISNINDQVNLDLSSRDIAEIEPTLFHNCQKVGNTSIYSRNKLKTLDKNLFVDCTNLKELDLGSNNIGRNRTNSTFSHSQKLVNT
jgi:hypothetical protein